MDYALVFKWTKPIPGREAKALEVLADVTSYFSKLAVEGKIGDPLVLTQVNDGMMIVPGEMAALFDITNSDEFITMIDKAMFVAGDFRFDGYFIHEGMARRMVLYAEAGRELAYL